MCTLHTDDESSEHSLLLLFTYSVAVMKCLIVTYQYISWTSKRGLRDKPLTVLFDLQQHTSGGVCVTQLVMEEEPCLDMTAQRVGVNCNNARVSYRQRVPWNFTPREYVYDIS